MATNQDWRKGKVANNDFTRFPRFAVNDPSEGDDCKQEIVGVYRETIQEVIEGKKRLAYHVTSDFPLVDAEGKEHREIVVWGNHQIDAIIPTLPRGTPIALTYMGKTKIGGGRTLKNIKVEYPGDVQRGPNPYLESVAADTPF